jgi:hypothetical protein
MLQGWCRAGFYSVGRRLVCLWLLGALGIYVADAPSTRGKSINLTEVWLMDDTGCRGFFLAPVTTYHRKLQKPPSQSRQSSPMHTP